MPRFSKKSSDKLATCALNLQKLFNEVVKEYDCTILEGHRSSSRQYQLYNEGKSKVTISSHNHNPSRAVDVTPYPIPKDWGENDFKEKAKFYYFAGYVKGVAKKMGVHIRWGGDWDKDHEFNDQTFDDLVHFEIDVN